MAAVEMISVTSRQTLVWDLFVHSRVPTQRSADIAGHRLTTGIESGERLTGSTLYIRTQIT